MEEKSLIDAAVTAAKSSLLEAQVSGNSGVSLFPKAFRFLTRRDFRRPATRKYFLQCLQIEQMHSKRPRLGIVVTRRFGKAVARNRFKRRVRESYRLLRSQLPPSDFLIRPRKNGTAPTFHEIQADLLTIASASEACASHK